MVPNTAAILFEAQGPVPFPLAWDWHLSSDVDVNYMVIARR